MKNKKVIGLIVILIILIGGAYYVGRNYKKENNISLETGGSLPNSFVIEAYLDGSSSSGAVRIYNSKLTFFFNKLISGSESYYTIQGGHCAMEDCKKNTIECVIKNGQWIDKTNNTECNIRKHIALTKGEIEEQIKTKEIIQSNDFSNCHNKTCYRIK